MAESALARRAKILIIIILPFAFLTSSLHHHSHRHLQSNVGSKAALSKTHLASIYYHLSHLTVPLHQDGLREREWPLRRCVTPALHSPWQHSCISLCGINLSFLEEARYDRDRSASPRPVKRDDDNYRGGGRDRSASPNGRMDSRYR